MFKDEVKETHKEYSQCGRENPGEIS